MNIEEAKNLLGWVSLNKLYIDTHNECDYHNIHTAIETLLTAYEKEKEEHKKECHNCDEYTAKLGELETENKMLKSELEKEKEKNKKIEKELEKHIKFCEQEAEGSLHNEICLISLRFNKKLLNILNEEE